MALNSCCRVLPGALIVLLLCGNWLHVEWSVNAAVPEYADLHMAMTVEETASDRQSSKDAVSTADNAFTPGALDGGNLELEASAEEEYETVEDLPYIYDEDDDDEHDDDHDHEHEDMAHDHSHHRGCAHDKYVRPRIAEMMFRRSQARAVGWVPPPRGAMGHAGAAADGVDDLEEEQWMDDISVEDGRVGADLGRKGTSAWGHRSNETSGALLQDGRRHLLDATGAGAVPVRIHVEYQLSGLSPHKLAYLEKKLVPAAIQYIQSILYIRNPVQGRLLLTRECEEARESSDGRIHCLKFSGHQCLEGTLEDRFFDPQLCKELKHATGGRLKHTECDNNPHGRGGRNANQPGIPDADFLLLITARDTVSCHEAMLAAAGHCLLDMDSDRPLAGNANFCPTRLSEDPEDWDLQLHTTIHEMLHALGFSSLLFPFYRHANGEPRVTRDRFGTIPMDSAGNFKADISAVMATFHERDNVVHKLVTPAVTAAARAHFGCPALNGAELEHQGGIGTADSHWESRIFFGEMMVGKGMENQVLSAVTLAAFEDSGWYLPVYANAGFLQFGHMLGCDFALRACSGPVMPDVFQGSYCSSNKVHRVYQGQELAMPTGCTYDGMAVGGCAPCTPTEVRFHACLTDGCTRLKRFSNYRCTNPGRRAHHERDNHRNPEYWGQAFSDSSRCFGTGFEPWIKDKWQHPALGAGCFERRCRLVHGRWLLEVHVGSSLWVKCVDNQVVDASGSGHHFKAAAIGPCPVADEYCPDNACLFDCSNKGMCHNLTCHCLPGYTGPYCERELHSAWREEMPAFEAGQAARLAKKGLPVPIDAPSELSHGAIPGLQDPVMPTKLQEDVLVSGQAAPTAHPGQYALNRGTYIMADGSGEVAPGNSPYSQVENPEDGGGVGATHEMWAGEANGHAQAAAADAQPQIGADAASSSGSLYDGSAASDMALGLSPETAAAAAATAFASETVAAMTDQQFAMVDVQVPALADSDSGAGSAAVDASASFEDPSSQAGGSAEYASQVAAAADVAPAGGVPAAGPGRFDWLQLLEKHQRRERDKSLLGGGVITGPQGGGAATAGGAISRGAAPLAGQGVEEVGDLRQQDPLLPVAADVAAQQRAKQLRDREARVQERAKRRAQQQQDFLAWSERNSSKGKPKSASSRAQAQAQGQDLPSAHADARTLSLGPPGPQEPAQGHSLASLSLDQQPAQAHTKAQGQAEGQDQAGGPALDGSMGDQVGMSGEGASPPSHTDGGSALFADITAVDGGDAGGVGSNAGAEGSPAADHMAGPSVDAPAEVEVVAQGGAGDVSAVPDYVAAMRVRREQQEQRALVSSRRWPRFLKNGFLAPFFSPCFAPWLPCLMLGNQNVETIVRPRHGRDPPGSSLLPPPHRVPPALPSLWEPHMAMSPTSANNLVTAFIASHPPSSHLTISCMHAHFSAQPLACRGRCGPPHDPPCHPTSHTALHTTTIGLTI
eukprot:jgi/Mesvir1/25554/Mv01791-RA.2